MSRTDDERVADILDASAQVGQIVAGGEAGYRADPVRQLAIERLLEIIGESGPCAVPWCLPTAFIWLPTAVAALRSGSATDGEEER